MADPKRRIDIETDPKVPDCTTPADEIECSGESTMIMIDFCSS